MNWLLILLCLMLLVSVVGDASAAEPVVATIVDENLGLTFFFLGLAAMCAGGWFCWRSTTVTLPTAKAKWKIVHTPDDFWRVYRKGRFTGIWWLQDSFCFRGSAETHIKNKVNPEIELFDSKGEPID